MDSDGDGVATTRDVFPTMPWRQLTPTAMALATTRDKFDVMDATMESSGCPWRRTAIGVMA